MLCVLAALISACAGSDFSSDPLDAAPDVAGSGGSQSDAAGGSGSTGAGGSGGAGGVSTGGSSGGSGASFGGAAGAGAAGAAGQIEDGSVDAEPDATDPDAGEGGCVLVQYYFDGDADGWGSTTTTSACTKPDGAWVTQGGDCDDGIGHVNPGQTSYFDVGYVKTGSTDVSFDYDCSGVEKEAGNSPKAACQVQGFGCIGGGYLFGAPLRSGPGVDPFCGSDQRVNCNYVNLKCPASAPYAAPAIACR